MNADGIPSLHADDNTDEEQGGHSSTLQPLLIEQHLNQDDTENNPEDTLQQHTAYLRRLDKAKEHLTRSVQYLQRVRLAARGCMVLAFVLAILAVRAVGFPLAWTGLCFGLTGMMCMATAPRWGCSRFLAALGMVIYGLCLFGLFCFIGGLPVVAVSVMVYITISHALRMHPNIQKAQQVALGDEKMASFTQRVQQSANRVRTQPDLPALSQTAPLDGFYLNGREDEDKGGARPKHLDAIFFNFLPSAKGDGWWIRGGRTSVEYCLSTVVEGVDKNQACGRRTVIREGFCSSTLCAYWVEENSDKTGVALYEGMFRADNGKFVGTRQSLEGQKPTPVELTAVCKTECTTHFSIICDHCRMWPLQGIRYVCREKKFDLCQSCWDRYHEISKENDKKVFPLQSEFEALAVCQQTPYQQDYAPPSTSDDVEESMPPSNILSGGVRTRK